MRVELTPLQTTLLALAFGFLGLGLTKEWNAKQELRHPAIGSQEPIRFLGEFPAKERIEVTVHLRNFSDEKITILGSSRVCTRQCCARIENLPVEVAAHADHPIRILLDTNDVVGDFQCPITLYTDRDGSREVKMYIAGRVSPSIEAPNSKVEGRPRQST